MRASIVALSIYLTCCFLPTAPQAAEQTEDWRRRASSESVDVAKDDVSEEIRFGREVAARMIGRFGLYENTRLMKYVNLVGRTLALNTNRPEIAFHFAVLNTDEINAYAAPGGYVFVTRGALSKMQDESELAAVIAHEMTHIIERHVVKELNIHGTEGSAAGGLARLIGGGTEAARIAFYQSVDKAMDMLFKTGYGREDEIQADKGAILLCALSGYDPSGLGRYFGRIGSVKGKATETIDKTHPPFADRITWLKDMVAKEGLDAASLSKFPERFLDVQKGIK